MKNDREVMQALLDGETLINDAGIEWVINDDGNVSNMHSFPPYWYLKTKQKTININGFYVQEPLRIAPDIGTVIFLASTNCTIGNNYANWVNNSVNFEWLKKGIVHLTRGAAQKHIDALLSFTKVK